ncbi:MAG: SGNH/GDSL hydrolase family protein [Gemmiger sp.]|nr:SGNH/GDSL hydrolase family protein [Gemmiger sp.]
MRVLFQGDSITDGGWVRNADPNHLMGQSYAYLVASRVGFLAPEKNHEFFNRGISGDSCAKMGGRWQEDTLDLKPDILSILVGINDVGIEANSPRELAYHGMRGMYGYLLNETLQVLPKVRLVMMEPFFLDSGNMERARFARMEEGLQDYRRDVRELAEQYNAVFVPLQSRFEAAAKRMPANYWLWDSVHPTYAGHGLIADAWLEKAGDLLLK